jgi:sugar lactone lactonase YvrE
MTEPFCAMPLTDNAPGATDGMKVDQKDNIYSAGPGVRIFSANGKHLGTIQVQRLLFELFAVSVSPNRLRAAVHSEDILNQEQIRS